MQAEPDAAGKMVKCPGCGAKIKIPGDASLTSPVVTKANLAAPEAPPKPSLPKPSGVDIPKPSAPAAAADPKPQDEAPPEAGHEHTAAGPRPIEFFYGTKLGNLASVNFWISLGIGAGLTVVWFGLMKLIHASFPADPNVEGSKAGTYLSILFLERSWVQVATTALSFWTLGILILKSAHIQRQKRSLLIEILPQDISPEINIHSIADFYDHVVGLPQRLHHSFMFHRIRKGLEFFYIRESNTEVASMMSSQSDIDANSISGSYALTKVFLWAIPIFGFVGTVLGIGAAIGNFAEALAGSDPDALMNGLKDVLAGLGTAFDTTFLALVFSILLMIPASALQAAEEEVLNQVDEYCNDNLIKRLNDGGSGAQFTDAAALKALGEAIAASNKDVVGKFGEIHGNMKEVYDQQTSHYQKVAEAVDKQLGSIDARAKNYETRLDEDFFKNLDRIRTESVDTISSGIKPLTEGIIELNKLLKDLDGKQVVVKKKRWLFG